MSQNQTADPAPLTTKSLEALAGLHPVFMRHGVAEIRVSASGLTARLLRTQLVQAINELGSTPSLVPINVPGVWTATIGYAGAVFDGWVTTEDLPSIGYRLNEDGRPVPMDKSATA